MKPYRVKEFDYEHGDYDIEFYETMFPIASKRAMIYGSNGVASANWDLQTMTLRWQQTHDRRIAAKVRAMYDIVTSLMNGEF